MTVHAHSIEAFNSLNLGERCAVVLSAYASAGKPITERQCMHVLGFSEPGSVRPRVTRLIHGLLQKDGSYIDGGYLEEVGETKCEYTGKTVRLCTITEKVSR